MNNLHNEVPTKVVTSSYSINDEKYTHHVIRDEPDFQPPNTLDSSSVSNSGEPWDKIYELLQQMNDLRDANSKLQKKVQFLEGMKLLTKLHQEIRDDPEFSEFFSDFFRQKYEYLEGEDRVFEDQENTDMIVNRNNFSKSRENKKTCSSSMSREEKLSFLARQRSKSVGHEEIVKPATERTKLISSKSKRFPRWARVKTALGWDKSSQSNVPVASSSDKNQGKGKKPLNEITSDDSVCNANGSQFINYDEDSESNCTELDRGSSKSSTRGGSERRILGLKSIISSRKNSVTRSSIKSSIETSTRNCKGEHEHNHEHRHKRGQGYKPLVDDEDDENGISITLGSGIKGSKSMGDISCDANSRSRYLADNLNCIGKSPTESLKGRMKTETADLKTTSDYSSRIADDNAMSVLDQITIGKYAKSRYRSTEVNTGSQRMPSMSPPVKRRSKWIKMRKVFANASEGVPRPNNPSLDLNLCNVHSVPASPMSSDTSFNYVMAWNENENENETGSGYDGAVSGYDVTYGNERHLQEVERSDEGDFMLPLSESATEPVLNLVQELQRNLSEDFRKKIEEWERIKAGEVAGGSRGGSSDGCGLGTSATKITSNSKVERKPSLPKLKTQKSDRKLDKYRTKYKDINWVEKELSRVSKEKEKLDRERTKFEERIKVLQKCKEDALATEKGVKKEIFVRTSEGEFRFEGITDDFTRKLHEWETKKGLCPEFSIMTLLDSSPGPSSCTTLGSPPSLDASGFDQDNPQIGSTSKNVRHSQSTRYPLNRCISRSENSLIDLQNSESGPSAIPGAGLSSKVTSTSLPSLKKPEPCPEYESILLPSPSPGSPKDIHSRRDHLMRQQQHVARQLFNLESSSDYQPVTIPGWGDSEKCMVTVNPDGSTIIVGSKQDIYEMTKEILGEAGDEGYISLLEANMFLLEKLNAKEDVCRNLEMQLKQLDSKMDEMNATHRKEMERYREKLWEIHGNKTINDSEESDKVINELKDRIEALQLCSDRLRADKEALEDSFNYHSEQQAKLAIELIGRMRNLQEISCPTDLSGNTEDNLDSVKNDPGIVKCNPENVIKLHDLSTRLLEKARELESALVERTKQICRLRWELLHREVSAMKLKTELHSSLLQDGSRAINVPTAKIKRSRYGSRRSWSSSERLNYQMGAKGNQSGFDVDSWIISEDWPKIQKESSELSETVQQLKMELLKLASQAQSRTENFPGYLNEGDTLKLEGMKRFHGLFSSPLMKDLIQDGKQHNYTEGNKFTAENNRSSNDNLDSLSGLEGSESSSLNDVERAYVLRLPRNRWRRSRDNVSSSSESSFKEEESFTAAEWCRPRTNSYLLRRAKSSFARNSSGSRCGGEDTGVEEETVTRQEEGRGLEPHRSVKLAKEMVLSYGDHSMSRSSSEMTDQRNDSWEKLYKKRLIFNQFSETSSSAYNEGLEESSSTSTNNPFPGYYDTPDSTQSNLRSSSSSGQDRYIGIPMIDEDYLGSSIGGGLVTLAGKVSEFQVIPEGQVLPMAGEERRHSEPCRKFKYSIRSVNRKLVCNSSLSMAEVKEDQTPSPVVYTIRLSPSRFESKKTEDGNHIVADEKQSKETPQLSSSEYIVCEPKKNIFFTMNSNEDDSRVCSRDKPTNQTFAGDQLQSTSTFEKSTLSVISPVVNELLDTTCTVSDPQYNRSPSPSSFSLTSLGSEQSIVRPRSSQDSQESVKERDQIWAMNRSPSKTSITSKVVSLINHRSGSKSRPGGGESTNQSAIGALCRQSIALTVDPGTVINETPSHVIVTEALVSATSTATATISLSPSLSSTLLVPSSSSSIRSILQLKESIEKVSSLDEEKVCNKIK